MTKYKAKKTTDIKEINKKQKTIKPKKELTDTEATVRNYILILLIVILILVIVIFATTKLVDSRNENTTNNETTEVEIKYDEVTVGTLLNRPEKEYYVLIYNKEDVESVKYDNLYFEYSTEENAKPIYKCDLNDTLNKEYVSGEETGNIKAKTTEEFSFGKLTLIQVKDGKVVTYTEGYDNIKSILK